MNIVKNIKLNVRIFIGVVIRMTEKRFNIINNRGWIKDSKTNEEYCPYSVDGVTNTVDLLNSLNDENEQLKQTMKEVAELLSEEVDLFSDKATEHDICAYVELKELDNKDAYYMAISTKKAIKMLKGDV